MQLLAIDMGNTRLKWGQYLNGTLQQHGAMAYTDEAAWQQWLGSQHSAQVVGVVSTTAHAHPWLLQLQAHFAQLEVLGAHSAAPIHNDYGTPHTLGADRWVAVCGARKLTPSGALLVIDAGTAITYDYLTPTNHYLGGAISPGVQLRYQALHQYTARLPLLAITPEWPILGNSTAESINSGVQEGIRAEMDGCIANYRALADGQLSVWLTGGDAAIFEKRLKNPIFAHPNLVLEGIDLLVTYRASLT